MICHGGLGFHFVRQPHVISCNINGLNLTMVVFHILYVYTVYPRVNDFLDVWISPAISSPKVMARSARGDKCSLCGMDRACDLDATAPGLAAKWITKGPTMDLYIWVKTW